MEKEQIHPAEKLLKDILHRRGALHIINGHRFYTESSVMAALREASTENTQSIAGDSTPRLSLQEIEKANHVGNITVQEFHRKLLYHEDGGRKAEVTIYDAMQEWAVLYAQQQQGGLDGETLVRSSDYAELEIKYNKLKDAFESAIGHLAAHVTYTPFDHENFIKEWREQAGIVLQEQK